MTESKYQALAQWLCELFKQHLIQCRSLWEEECGWIAVAEACATTGRSMELPSTLCKLYQKTVEVPVPDWYDLTEGERNAWCAVALGSTDIDWEKP